MSWLNPSALFALAAIAAPILIHILVQRRAERFPFPTLRFLQPTRLAAIRRHLLEDPWLLAIRIGVLAAAVVALAGPLLVTAARRRAWDNRLAQAIVIDDDATAAATAFPSGDDRPGVTLQQRFEGPSLPDGIRRAILWLETTPPARREIVIASPFPIGSITNADVAAVPGGIGIRFERRPTLPATRTAPGGRLLTPTGVRAREVTLSGERTSFRDVDLGDPAVWPIEIVASAADKPALAAAAAAVLSEHVWAAPPDRRARVVLMPLPSADRKVRTTPEGGTDRPTSDVVQAFRPAGLNGVSDAVPITVPWMADAVARIARDADLQAASRRVTGGLADNRFVTAPWQVLAVAADGRPLAATAGSADRLLVASAAGAMNLATPVLLRSIANGIATVPDLQQAEVMPIADAVLKQWSRLAAPVVSPRIETVDHDDRRWLWLAALCLLALEHWVRRARPVAASQQRKEADASVA
jgi:hypothetical protein